MIRLNLTARNPRKLSAIGGVIALIPPTWESCYNKDHANTEQQTVPWLQSTRGEASIPTQKTDTELPGLGISIPITKPPAKGVIPVKVAVTTAVEVTRTTTKVCAVPIVQTQI